MIFHLPKCNYHAIAYFCAAKHTLYRLQLMKLKLEKRQLAYYYFGVIFIGIKIFILAR